MQQSDHLPLGSLPLLFAFTSPAVFALDSRRYERRIAHDGQSGFSSSSPKRSHSERAFGPGAYVCARAVIVRIQESKVHSEGSVTRRIAICFAAALASLISAPGFAQSSPPLLNSVNDQTRTPVPGEGHDYQKMLGETIDFSNGSVTFKINFPTPSGRGISLPYAWTYNSAAVNTLDSTDGNTPLWNLEYQHPWPQQDGWNYAVGVPKATVQVFSITPPTGPPGQSLIPCNMQSGMTFTDGSGTQHNLYTGAQVVSYTAQNDFSICPNSQIVRPPGGDGEVAATIYPQAAANMAGSGPTTGYFLIEDKDGTIYTFDDSATSSSPNVTAYVTMMEDRNGNYIYFPGPLGAAWVDTAGRSGPVTSGGTPPTSIMVDNLAYTANWGTENVNYTVTAGGGGSSPVGCATFPTSVTGTKTVLSSLVLPNGQKYQFFYGTYGLLNEIIYPDGGWIKYTWVMSSQPYELASLGGFETTQNSVTPVPYGCNWNYTVPVLSTRTVSFDGQHVAQSQSFTFGATWSYTNNIPNGWTQKTASVSTTDQVVTPNVTSKISYTYAPWYIPSMPYAGNGIANSIPLESTITYYDWGQSSASKVVSKTWTSNQFNSPKLLSETTALYVSGGATRTSETTYSYTSGLCSNPSLSSFVYPTEQDDYDFGSGGVGPLKKRILYNYQCFPAPNVGTYSSWYPGPPSNQWGASYQGMVLPPQLSSVTVEDGQGNIQAETRYGYDAYSPGIKAVSPGQFDPNYNRTTFTTRSNLTSVTHCTASFGPSCTGPTETYNYDVSGQLASRTDPRGNTTTYSFADSFTDETPPSPTNAYLTNITYPPVNGITLQKNFTYSYVLGYLISSIDENSQPTTYSYSDVLNRLNQINYPDGGETTYAYNDTAATVTTSKLLNTSTWETSIANMDGLFHTIETQLTTDPYGTDIVKTTYDGEGHIYQKTNPYRGTTSNGTITYRYDAFGKPIETIEQDGSSIIQMCYNGLPSSPSVYCSSGQLGSTVPGYGIWVDTTDEVGNHSQHVSDAFERLFQVMEPNGPSQTASMETDYKYNTLNNLLEVDQYGGAKGNSNYVDRIRSFMYDNLSRLLSATNAENGTIGYGYDANGNVTTKIDHRNVATTFTYDALNRVVSKSYSSDPSGTPSSCYQYDGPVSSNGHGRLWNAWTLGKSSSCTPALPGSGFLTVRANLAYDQMGRETSEQKCTPNQCSLTSGPILSFGYDKAGNPTSLTNPLGAAGSPLTLNSYIDGAARPCLMTSTWSGTPNGTFPENLFQVNPSTGSTAGYTAFGSLQNWYMGSSSSTPSTSCSPVPNSPMNVTQGYTPRFWLNNISATGQVP